MQHSLLSNFKSTYSTKQEFIPIYIKQEVLHTSDCTPKNTPPHKWNGKVKPIQHVQEKYNLASMNIHNYMAMKVIVLESITLNPNQLWKQHYYPYQWYRIIHHSQKKQSTFLLRK